MTPDTPVDLAVAEERWAAGLPVTDTETSALFAEVKRLRADRDALIARLRDAAAQVLADHWLEARGMTRGSSDRCSCGMPTLPEDGGEEITIRRARAFARHQADVIADVIA